MIDWPLKTLFKILDLEVGWLKCTDALEPTLKVSQFTIAWFDDWLTSILPELFWEIDTLPVTTFPPVGRVSASTVPAKAIGFELLIETKKIKK